MKKPIDNQRELIITVQRHMVLNKTVNNKRPFPLTFIELLKHKKQYQISTDKQHKDEEKQNFFKSIN